MTATLPERTARERDPAHRDCLWLRRRRSLARL